MVRIGMVDFDTSHVVEFTRRLHGVGVAPEDVVEGAGVAAACPGASDMMPERIPVYAEQMRDLGVELVDDPLDLLGRVDAVMVESQQGSKHLRRAEPFLQRGLPVFVDKPFACSLEDAEAMISPARRHGAPLMSCSALRYDPKVLETAALQGQLGECRGVDVWSSAALHPGNPGLFHYGIHGVEMVYALMGAGCRTVRSVSDAGGSVTVGIWPGQRMATLRGLRAAAGGFGFVYHGERGRWMASIEGAAFYSQMLRRVVAMFETGAPPIDLSETREIVAFILAAAASEERDGAPVDLQAE